MVWTTILLYILIALLGFFLGTILPLMSVSKAFRKTDEAWVTKSSNYEDNWDDGCRWYRSMLYKNFYGGKN